MLKSKMRCKFRANGFMKEILFAAMTLFAYLCVGICRSYVAFLFHHLDMPNSIIKITDEQKSWLASSIGFLGPVGCIFSGTLMDFCGRKLYLIMIYIPFAISWLIITLSKNYTILFLGMLLQGLGGGMSFCVSTYISEIAAKEHRGALLSIIAVAYNIGIMLCNITMYNFQWNVSSIIFLALSLIFMASMSSLPESPKWLYNKGKKEEAIKILCSIRCTEKEQLEDEIQDMEKSNKTAKMTITSMLTSIRKAWRQFITVAVLFTLLQHTGYSVMVAYNITVFDRLNIPFDSSKMAVLYSTIGFIGSLTTPLFMHRLGRKTILSISSFGMAICMIAVGIYEELFLYENIKLHAWIVPLAFYIYGLVATIGVHPLGFIIGGEIFPNEVRGTMNGIYGMFGYIYWATTLKVYPKLMFYFGIKTMIWTFAISCLIICLHGIFILPETHGKTLNEVQEQYFAKKKKNQNQMVHAPEIQCTNV